jgi:ElaA protein
MRRSTRDHVTAEAVVRSATFAELDAATLYAILQLRSDVFVVEQRCTYCDPDGRDTEPTTRHLWIARAEGAVGAYVRMLDEGGGVTRIGRVVTAPELRGRGLADRLVRHAVEAAPGLVVASVQAHLTGWYGRRGFVVDGPGFVEDGIDHVPMRRDPGTVGWSG